MGDHPPGAPPVGIQAAVPPFGPLATPATRATASAFFYRLEVRRTWTEASAGGGTAYRIDVAVCNQTSTPRAIRLAALTVVVRPRGRPGAVGYGLKPDAAPGDGFADAPLVPPGGCVGGVVTITPPQSEVPDTLWYRSGDGREAADPVALPFPD